MQPRKRYFPSFQASQQATQDSLYLAPPLCRVLWSNFTPEQLDRFEKFKVSSLGSKQARRRPSR